MSHVRDRLQYLVFVLLIAATFFTGCALVPSELVSNSLDASVDTQTDAAHEPEVANDRYTAPRVLQTRFSPEDVGPLNWIELRQLNVDTIISQQPTTLATFQDGGYRPVELEVDVEGSRTYLQVVWETMGYSGTNVSRGLFCSLDPESNRFVFSGTLEVMDPEQNAQYGTPRLTPGQRAECWIEFTSSPCSPGFHPEHGNICVQN